VNGDPRTFTEADARAALAELTRRAETTGRSPSMLALAQHLGVPNTTLRRRFPGLVAELAAARRVVPPSAGDDGPVSGATYAALLSANARLRERNRELTEHLELAIANIARLSLDNSELRQALHHAKGIVTIRPARGAGPSA
jgi:hypothetical protein